MAFTTGGNSDFLKNVGLYDVGNFTLYGEIPNDVSHDEFIDLANKYISLLREDKILNTNYVTSYVGGIHYFFNVEDFDCFDDSYALIIRMDEHDADNFLKMISKYKYKLKPYITFKRDFSGFRFPEMLNYFIVTLLDNGF